MIAQINSRWSFNDEDAAQLICLSNIGREILLFLSANEDAVQLMAARMQQVERELQCRCGSVGGNVMGSSTKWQQQHRDEGQQFQHLCRDPHQRSVQSFEVKQSLY